MKPGTCVIILAGGNSSRMDFPKPFLMYREKTFLQIIAETYCNAGFKNIGVVLNKYYAGDEWQYLLEPVRSLGTIFENKFPAYGRLYSLKLAAKEMKGFEFYFIQNADNPFPDGNIISTLWKNRNERGYVSPVFKGKGGHPVLLSKKIIEHILSTSSDTLTLREILCSFDRRKIETGDERVGWNINTKEDYEKYIQQASEAVR